MLLATASASGEAGCLALLARATALFGAPSASVVRGATALMAWGQVPHRHEDWFAEGRLDVPPDVPSSEPLLARAARARGDFALIGADHRGVVVTAGGAGGYRPVYVRIVEGETVLASTSLDAACRILGAPDLEPDAIAAQAALLTVFLASEQSGEQTLFRHVKRLRMYEAWHVDATGRIDRVDTFRPLSGSEHLPSREDLGAALRRGLRASVRRALEGHSKVGVYLSGGLDSSSVAALARDLTGRGGVPCELFPLSWEYATDYGDDRPYIRAMARHLAFEPERTTPQEAAQGVGTTFVVDGLPFHTAAAPLIAMAAARARAKGVTLALTGGGGDEMVNGDPRIFADLLATGRPLRAVAGALRMKGAGVGSARGRLEDYAFRPLLRRLTPAAIRHRRKERALFREYPWAGPRLRRYLVTLARGPLAPEPRLETSPAERFARLARSQFALQYCILRRQEEAISGFDRREPFLDEEFLRVVANVPPLALLRGHWLRGLLRSAMGDLLPDEVRWRTTKAAIEPALGEMVVAAGGFERFESLARAHHLADLGIVEPRVFLDAFWALARRPGATGWFKVWPVLAVEAFLRQREGRETPG
jgi:asparagine synthase (glutamine-hydrolysing)